jgi:hypothetical protein
MIERVSPNGGGRLVSVSLRDVPLKLRRRYARHLTEAASRYGGLAGLEEARQVTRAVLMPSERTYLLPEAAVVAMLGAVPNGQRRKYAVVAVGDESVVTPDGWA